MVDLDAQGGAGGMGGLGMTENYEAWNRAIASWFFGPERSGRPAYLAVDDEQLAAIAASIGEQCDPASALATAVQSGITRIGDSMFRKFSQSRWAWREKGAQGDPPYLGLLALCVLAASRMASDENSGVHGNDYYVQLNTLLALTKKKDAPPGFEQLSGLWEDLNQWLDGDCGGQRGRATAAKREQQPFISWPMSQCLLRAADLHRLPDFFRSARLEPRADIDPEQLYVLFRHWASAGTLTQHGLRTLRNEAREIRASLAVLLSRELQAWDGELRDSHGRRRAEILLAVRLLAGGRRAELHLVVRRPEGFPGEADFAREDGRTVKIETTGPDWYRPLQIPVDSAVLTKGLRLTADGYSLSYEPRSVIPLRAEPEPFSAWISKSQADPVQDHVVMVSNSVLEETKRFLSRAAESRWKVVRPPELPKGWSAITGVRIVSIPDSAPDALRPLVPRLFTAMQLEGGLKLAHRLYLTGGEPDLFVTIEEGREAEVEIDGCRESMAHGLVKLQLSKMELPVGEHEAAASGQRVKFRSERTFGLARTRGSGSMGHAITHHNTYRPTSEIAGLLPTGRPPRGTVFLSGACPSADPADLPLPDQPPILVPFGYRECAVLGAEAGVAERFYEPSRPGWLSRVGIEHAQFFDFAPRFSPRWLVQFGNFTSARWLGALPEEPRTGSADVAEQQQLWADIVLRATDAGLAFTRPGDRDLWERYVSLAREIVTVVEV